MSATTAHHPPPGRAGSANTADVVRVCAVAAVALLTVVAGPAVLAAQSDSDPKALAVQQGQVATELFAALARVDPASRPTSVAGLDARTAVAEVVVVASVTTKDQTCLSGWHTSIPAGQAGSLTDPMHHSSVTGPGVAPCPAPGTGR